MAMKFETKSTVGTQQISQTRSCFPLTLLLERNSWHGHLLTYFQKSC